MFNMLHYSIHSNDFNPSPDGKAHHGKIKSHRTVDIKEVVKRMITNGSTVTEPDTLAVYAELQNTLKFFLLNGFSVKLDGICTISTAISGKFDGPTDSFDNKRHAIEVGLRPDQQLKKHLNINKLMHKDSANSPVPHPVSIYNHRTASYEDTLSKGGTCTIKGRRLKCVHSQDDEGIFLIDPDTSNATKMVEISHNTARKLMFQVPDVAPGEYFLEVRSRLTKNVKKLRVGSYSGRLTVI